LFFYYNTLLQTSTYKNGKFDIKKAGFIRPARYFSNIQLSNSREGAMSGLAIGICGIITVLFSMLII
ncbi:hypothetical protein PZH38_13025, partial [[Ruminococcus] lactaris]|nr:hypothetical protein [[Ruminococcus] lactaris]